MKTTKEMIDVMQAYERGEQIQAKSLDNDIYGWDDTKEPFWNWHNLDYRVKPKKNYVPFDTAEEFLAAQRLHGRNVSKKGKDEEFCAYVNDAGYVAGNVAIIQNTYNVCDIVNFKQFFKNYEFEDRTVCGKEVEE